MKSDPEMNSDLKNLEGYVNNMHEILSKVHSDSDEDYPTNFAPNKGKSQNQNQKVSSELARQLENFRSQAQIQQKQAQKHLEQSISQAMQILNEANQYIKSNLALTQMNGLIEKAQMELSDLGIPANSSHEKKDPDQSNDRSKDEENG